jgi:hypothetical protein
MFALLTAVRRFDRDDSGERACRTWVSLTVLNGVSPALLHRGARWLIAKLTDIGVPALYVFSDPRRPDGDRWLSRLGFTIDLSQPGPAGCPVWSKRLETSKCDFSA